MTKSVGTMNNSMGEEIIKDLLNWMGCDLEDPGIVDTPRRVISAWHEMLEGYDVDPEDLLKVQFNAHSDEMITLSGIPFYSTCEHHLLPFSGIATISYLPSEGRVVGISKLARLVDCFARRLQIQERMVAEIADTFMKIVEPKGVGVYVKATHLCMVCRGVQKPGAAMQTTALRGVYKDQTVRQEFLAGL